MPKLQRLSGSDVVRILSRFGFSVVAQRGSHMKLKRTLTDGSKQTLTIPNHPELDTGTCHAIFHQAMRYIPEQELREFFYST